MSPPMSFPQIEESTNFIYRIETKNLIKNQSSIRSIVNKSVNRSEESQVVLKTESSERSARDAFTQD